MVLRPVTLEIGRAPLTIVTGRNHLLAPAIEKRAIRVIVSTLSSRDARTWPRDLCVGTRDSPTGGDGFDGPMRCIFERRFALACCALHDDAGTAPSV